MKKTTLLLLIICLSFLSFSQNDSWQAKRITANQNQNESNSWYNFRKDVEIESVPDKALARIACDSKYWLWINGEMAVFEGQLKRGPTPEEIGRASCRERVCHRV